MCSSVSKPMKLPDGGVATGFDLGHQAPIGHSSFRDHVWHL